MSFRIAIVALIAVMSASCVTDSPAPLLPDEPAMGASTVRANPGNVISAIVLVRVQNADSVAVQFRVADVAANDSTTPAVLVVGDSAVVPVLGLLPARRYSFRPIAYGPGGSATGEELELTTGDLPGDLPAFTAGGVDPTPGYVVFASGKYGIVIDNKGRVVWYLRFENGPGLNFMAQPNGRYAARPQTPDPDDIEPWIEMDALGNVTRSLGCALGLQPRPHDLISEMDGGYWLMCDDTRTMDLTVHGGRANARVTGTNVQHIGPDGSLKFQWSPFDHFSVSDLPASDMSGAAVNWTHGNALEMDVDGNLLVSFRNLGEITKVSVSSGAVIWRLGGSRNQFTFMNLSGVAFSRQHGVRVKSAGQLVLLDNTGDPNESRSEWYSIDENARTARLMLSYGSVPRVVTQIGGSVQALAGGRTLASFGTEGRVEEYDSSGQIMWRIEGNPGYVFRAQRIRSLYAPGMGSSR